MIRITIYLRSRLWFAMLWSVIMNQRLQLPIAAEILKFVKPDGDGSLSLKDCFGFQSALISKEVDVEIARLALAVACLHAFTQENWTGPSITFPPSKIVSIRDATPSDEDLNSTSIKELALGGEPVYHLAQAVLLFRVAQLLLDLPFHHTPSISWWQLRLGEIHQRLLDERVTLSGELSADGILKALPTLPQDLAGRLVLEGGLVQHNKGNDKAAYGYFARAATIMDLRYELTGALGKRTKFQEVELSQLVLLTEGRDRASDSTQSRDTSTSKNGRNILPDTVALNDDTLLEHTTYTSATTTTSTGQLTHIDPSNQPELHPVDQCILLAMCLNVRNTSPTHGLTNEQMMPYVTRVLSHPRNWSVHTMALLLRSRLEANRTRTIERSTIQLQQLVEQMPTAESTAAERLLYFHSLPLPSKWELEKELAQRYMSLGVVKSALEIFERLEMWEEVVGCWQSMERPDKGILIVRDLLEGRRQESEAVVARSKANSTGDRRRVFDSAREAKLWCLLGDLEPEHAREHYERAWEISGQSSGRAMRSLGGYHFARNNFAEAVVCLRHAVRINPLLSRSWFLLGCACVREQNWKEARDSFSRCVAIDEEDGESWSNLATVYLRMGKSNDAEDSAVGSYHLLSPILSDFPQIPDEDEVDAKKDSIPFENKLLAFRALKQGLKFSYDNWRMWTNFMIVAVDVGELSEACRALGRIVEQRAEKDGGECVDEEVLERLVDAACYVPDDVADLETLKGDTQAYEQEANRGPPLARRVLDLIERQILPRIATSSRVFRAYSRLLVSGSRWSEALEAQFNAYRLGIAGSGKPITDSQDWKEAVGEVEEFIDVLRNFGPRAEAQSAADGIDPPKWRNQARSILRTFMGRWRRDFEDEPEFQRLEKLRSELATETDR